MCRSQSAPDCVPLSEIPDVGAGLQTVAASGALCKNFGVIRKLKTGEYRLYSRKINPKTGKRRNLGTFESRVAAKTHEREIQYFKRH